MQAFHLRSSCVVFYDGAQVCFVAVSASHYPQQDVRVNYSRAATKAAISSYLKEDGDRADNRQQPGVRGLCYWFKSPFRSKLTATSRGGGFQPNNQNTSRSRVDVVAVSIQGCGKLSGWQGAISRTCRYISAETLSRLLPDN